MPCLRVRPASAWAYQWISDWNGAARSIGPKEDVEATVEGVADVPGCLAHLDEVEPLSECPQNYPQACVTSSANAPTTNVHERP